ILVRVIAVGNEAQILDQSRCGRCTDIRRDPKPTAAVVSQAESGEPTKEEQARFQPVRDWGWDLLFFPQLTYDSSRGVVLGGLGTLTRYGFRLEPFSDQTTFGAAYSTGINQPRFDLATKIRTRSPVSILGFISYSGIDQVNFFGFGNQSLRDEALPNSDF